MCRTLHLLAYAHLYLHMDAYLYPYLRFFNKYKDLVTDNGSKPLSPIGNYPDLTHTLN